VMRPCPGTAVAGFRRPPRRKLARARRAIARRIFILRETSSIQSMISHRPSGARPHRARLARSLTSAPSARLTARTRPAPQGGPAAPHRPTWAPRRPVRSPAAALIAPPRVRLSRRVIKVRTRIDHRDPVGLKTRYRVLTCASHVLHGHGRTLGAGKSTVASCRNRAQHCTYRDRCAVS
jgi:hypothetical protein